MLKSMQSAANLIVAVAKCKRSRVSSRQSFKYWKTRPPYISRAYALRAMKIFCVKEEDFLPKAARSVLVLLFLHLESQELLVVGVDGNMMAEDDALSPQTTGESLSNNLLGVHFELLYHEQLIQRRHIGDGSPLTVWLGSKKQ